MFAPSVLKYFPIAPRNSVPLIALPHVYARQHNVHKAMLAHNCADHASLRATPNNRPDVRVQLSRSVGIKGSRCRAVCISTPFYSTRVCHSATGLQIEVVTPSYASIADALSRHNARPPNNRAQRQPQNLASATATPDSEILVVRVPWLLCPYY